MFLIHWLTFQSHLHTQFISHLHTQFLLADSLLAHQVSVPDRISQQEIPKLIFKNGDEMKLIFYFERCLFIFKILAKRLLYLIPGGYFLKIANALALGLDRFCYRGGEACTPNQDRQANEVEN